MPAPGADVRPGGAHNRITKQPDFIGRDWRSAFDWRATLGIGLLCGIVLGVMIVLAFIANL